jgi:hypothetical protein
MWMSGASSLADRIMRLPLGGRGAAEGAGWGEGALATLALACGVAGWMSEIAPLGIALLAGAASLAAWGGFANLRRYRAVADMPTSRVASAPQGYVELVGRGAHLPGERLHSHLSGLPCLWYRYRVEEKTEDRWRVHDEGVSHDTFALEDASGQCVIDPDGAEIVTTRSRTWTEGAYRCTEWNLIAGEPLYALGAHTTLGGANADLDRKADIAAVLTEWKRDRADLLKRFDANGDGEVDLAEWERARRVAEAQVDREHLETRLRDGVHILRRTADGRMYLIANSDPLALVRRYRRWAWVHAGLLCAALGALALRG